MSTIRISLRGLAFLDDLGPRDTGIILHGAKVIAEDRVRDTEFERLLRAEGIDIVWDERSGT